MRRRIFLGVFAITLVVFIACQAITLAVLYRYISEERKEEFRTEADYLSKAIEQGGIEVTKNLPTTGTIQAVYRITLIDSQGVVLYDNCVEAKTLENHKNREEVIEAWESGVGESSRLSDTLKEKTYNYAVLLDDGIVLRVSGSRYTVWSLLLSMLYPMTAVLVLVLLLAVFLASFISKNLVQPINNIDLESPDDRDIYPELRPLAQRINAQNRLLQKQMDELRIEHERQDKLRREFTANVSHELKTPLTSISGYAEILRAGIVQEEDVSRFAGKIYDETQRLITLVGDIIKLSELDDNDVVVEQTEINLLEASKQAIGHLTDAASRKHITIEVKGTPEIIVGIRQIIDEMIYNLCDNAIKYNREGGKVTVAVSRNGNDCILSVQDNGIGIPENEQDRVFERFYRVDKSHSKEVGGTGLGLSIVKHGASSHGASISIHSVLGQGTEISIRFPVK